MYFLALATVNVPFVPPVTVTSPVTKPVTSSDHVNVTLSAVVVLIAEGNPPISTAGESQVHRRLDRRRRTRVRPVGRRVRSHRHNHGPSSPKG